MIGLTMMDEPIVFSELVERRKLVDVVESIEAMFPIRVELRDLKGALLSEPCGVTVDPSLKRGLTYQTNHLGEVWLYKKTANDKTNLDAVARFLLATLETLVDSAYSKKLIMSVQESITKEISSELCTRNRQLESALERLEELERLKSNFLATISHELRTPLTSIIGYSEMLHEGLAGELNKEQKEFASTIRSKSEDLLQLITGILDVSTIEAKSLRLDLKPVSLVLLIEETADSLSNDFSRKNIEFSLNSDSLPFAMADRQKMQQVILQILANAIKFSEEGGRVEVDVSVAALERGDHSLPHSPFWRNNRGERFGLLVRVRDKGIGIPMNKRNEIFEPFYQVDSSTTRAYGGTGLGLSLARSHVIAHGGHLWLEDKKQEKGSTFVFTIPAVKGELDVYIDNITPPITQANTNKGVLSE